MQEELFVIVSKVPERISQYVASLRQFTSNFMFFSDIDSLVDRLSYVNVKVLILDNVDEDQDIVRHVGALRHWGVFNTTQILVIVKQEGCITGIEALEAGASDYMPFFLVPKELAVRVRTRISRSERDAQHYFPQDVEMDLQKIYPLEDRFTIKNSLECIKNDMASIRTVSDLSLSVGRSERELNRAFMMHFGKSAFEFLRDARINKAKELLVKTRFSIINIAEKIGYSSAANFATAFKSIVGQTPSNYKRQVMLKK